jgi:hypothetical protein
MSKKIMVLALAVVSAAFFALPAMASAEEIHWDTPEAFNISGAGGELRAASEPTITCTTTTGTGKFDAGSTTTGTSALVFTGCHTAVFGITASCKTTGEGEAAGKITTSGAFHLITWSETTTQDAAKTIDKDATKPAILLTPATTTIVCAGISTITTHGNVIGTITFPACGGSSNKLELSFTATGTVQTHNVYTGVPTDLTATTSDGVAHTAALVSTGNATNTQTNPGTLTCT